MLAKIYLRSVASYYGVIIASLVHVHAGNIKLGLLLPREGLQNYLGYETNAAASTMALEKCRKDGIIPGHNISIVYRDTKCTEKFGLGMAVNLYLDEHVDAFIGPACSEAAIPVGNLAAYWNIPMFAHASSDPSLSDKGRFPTVARVLPPYNKMGSALVELFNHYGWRRVVMLSTRKYNMISFAARAIKQQFRNNNITLADSMDAYTLTDNEIEEALERFEHRGRIIIVLLEIADVRRVMIHANKLGMTSGQYVFISSFNIVPVDDISRPWSLNNTYDSSAKDAFQSLIHVTVAFEKNEEKNTFLAEIPSKMKQPPWNFNSVGSSMTKPLKGSLYSLFLHDTVYLYCLALNRTSQMGSDMVSGIDMIETVKFDGMSGLVELDDKAERESDYWIWHLPPHKDKYEHFLEIKGYDRQGKRVRVINTEYWRTPDGKAPKDTPECGFFTEACLQSGLTEQEVGIIVGITCLFVVLGILSFAIYFYRRHRLEAKIDGLLWRVDYGEIVFSKVPNKTKTILGASKSVQSSTKSCTTSTTLSSKDDDGVRQTDKIEKRVGMVRGNLAYVKNVGYIGNLNNKDHKELKYMKLMNHHNVNAFIGICLSPGSICVLTAFCAKRSLQDVLANDDIKLDWLFKSSLISDVVSGMEYIHSSPLLSHGNLKSSNCVIDGRWVLKITDYGLHRFKLNQEYYDPDNDGDGEYAVYYAKLWTSPEIMRMALPPAHGTKKGDVYSFAIIVQEIIYRSGPYHSIEISPKDIVERVTMGENPPFRPEVREDSDAKPDIIDLMRDCWHENQIYRPTFKEVKKRLNIQNSGRRFNLMDKMMAKLETYTNNLEDLIEARTDALIEEKRKTDILLYRMLPGPIAESLKMGKVIEPEVYSLVTAFFSDIVSFTKLTKASSPMEIVTILNDLYILLDSIIAKYDVYKVETIGDSYMVVSGLPVRNGIKHVANIADMSLDMLNSIRDFRIRHLPRRKLQMRIGIHSGSCAAGVVGTAMPRYCLFGDTINLASRMESTAEPMRIQMSEEANNMLSKFDGYLVRKRGEVEIKGRGMLTTFWLEGKSGHVFVSPVKEHDIN
ncbi:unnamed protein product [Owenia fusiformis]|uniref:Guanylate cyclase n=1 Tax=Owenia fusiformis TaxID=6347 RepID=A0A8S4N454_OWEFU|nr:unnamed protein product [Owenia fusiformis]